MRTAHEHPSPPLTHTPAGSKTATSRRLASSVAARAGPSSPGGTQSHAPSSARCSPGRCQGSTHGRRCGFIGRPGRAAFLRPGPPPGCSRASMYSSNRSSAGCARPCRPVPPSRRCARWCSSARSQGRCALAPGRRVHRAWLQRDGELPSPRTRSTGLPASHGRYQVRSGLSFQPLNFGVEAPAKVCDQGFVSRT